MTIMRTESFQLNSFTDHLGCFIGEMEIKADYTKGKVSFKHYWIFNDLHKKGIEVNPTLNNKHEIIGMELIGTTSRIDYAKRFMNIVN